MAHNKAQVTELLTNYGFIDMMFFDGEAEGLKQLTWELSPQTLVTRGDMATPEQHIPDSRCPVRGRPASRWAPSGPTSRPTRPTNRAPS